MTQRPVDPAHGQVHDLLGIGLGPFNLGLACLAAPIDDLDAVFLEQADAFDWHPGLMIDGATIQVPFLADLVTMADPTSPFSFLNYLKDAGRLYRFYIRENVYPLRSEYNAYCRWAAGRVPGLKFGHLVERVEWRGTAKPSDRTDSTDSTDGTDGTEPSHYVVHVLRTDGSRVTFAARRLVLGIGTGPSVPEELRTLAGPAVHSADYLPNRDRLRRCDSITVVGSGQSAAEIYRDLLDGVQHHDDQDHDDQDHDDQGRGYRLDWITRSPRFFPMEYTKLTLELTSPDYVSYFHDLRPAQRETLLREQRSLYKGISGDLVDDIFDTLYRLELDDHGSPRRLATRLLTCTEVAGARWDGATGAYHLDLRHWETGAVTTTTTAGLVLATGYAPRVPGFLEPVRDRIRWDAHGRLDVARDYTVDHTDQEIFVQNAEEHSHGLAAPDLGMGAYRNSVILARVLGREVYPVERRIAFQTFGLPPELPTGASGTAGTSRETGRTPHEAVAVRS